MAFSLSFRRRTLLLTLVLGLNWGLPVAGATAGEDPAAPAAEALTSPAAYLQLIRGIQQKGLFYASLAHLDAYARRRPESEEAQVLRAHALRETGQAEKAGEAYRKLTQGAFAAEAYHGLGLIAMARGRYQEGVEAMGRAASLAPTNVDVLSDQGYALLLEGDREGARQSLFRAVELDSRNPRVGGNLALLWFVEQKPKQAEEVMRRYGLAEAVQRGIRQKAGELARSVP